MGNQKKRITQCHTVKAADKTIKGLTNNLGETEIVYLDDEKDLKINIEDPDINYFTSGNK